MIFVRPFMCAAAGYSALSQCSEALAVELRRELLGEEHPATFNAVAILARLYVQPGQFDKAGPLTKRASELGRDLPIENSPFLALSMSYLCWEYLEQGNVTQAEALSELAMQAMRRKPNRCCGKAAKASSSARPACPLSQRPAPRHGIPRTAGATLRRLGQTHSSRRVEKEAGRIPLGRQSRGQ